MARLNSDEHREHLKRLFPGVIVDAFLGVKRMRGPEPSSKNAVQLQNFQKQINPLLATTVAVNAHNSTLPAKAVQSRNQNNDRNVAFSVAKQTRGGKNDGDVLKSHSSSEVVPSISSNRTATSRMLLRTQMKSVPSPTVNSHAHNGAIPAKAVQSRNQNSGKNVPAAKQAGDHAPDKSFGMNHTSKRKETGARSLQISLSTQDKTENHTPQRPFWHNFEILSI